MRGARQWVREVVDSGLEQQCVRGMVGGGGGFGIWDCGWNRGEVDRIDWIGG